MPSSDDAMTQTAVPRYKFVKEALRRDIAGGVLKPGHRAPSERDLIHRYDVSSTTARRALNDLAVEGLIDRIQGKGSVVKPRANHRAWQKVGFVLSSDSIPSNPADRFLLELEDRFRAAQTRLLLLRFRQTHPEDVQAIQEATRMEALGALMYYGRIEVSAMSALTSAVKVPVLAVGNNGLPATVPHVQLDIRAAGRMAVERLLESGYKRMAIVNGGPGYVIARELYGAVRDTLAEHGMALDDRDVVWAPLGEARQQAMALLGRLDLSIPTGIVSEQGCTHDTASLLDSPGFHNRSRSSLLPHPFGLIAVTERELVREDGSPISAVLFSLDALAGQAAQAIRRLQLGQPLTPDIRLVAPHFHQGSTLLEKPSTEATNKGTKEVTP